MPVLVRNVNGDNAVIDGDDDDTDKVRINRLIAARRENERGL